MDYKVSTVPSGIGCELEGISSLDVKHLWQLSVRLSLTCLVVMLSLHSSVQFELIFLIFPLDDHLPQATTLSCTRVVAYEKVDLLASFLLPISLRAPFDRASNRRLRNNWGRFSFFVWENILTPLRHPLRHCPITAGLTLDERLLSSVANLYL